MRPRGEIRAALGDAATQFVAEGRSRFNFRDLAERSQVGYEAARVTTRNMERAGELVVLECRPLKAYTLPDAAAPRPRDEPVLELADVQCMWLELG